MSPTYIDNEDLFLVTRGDKSYKLTGQQFKTEFGTVPPPVSGTVDTPEVLVPADGAGAVDTAVSDEITKVEKSAPYTYSSNIEYTNCEDYPGEVPGTAFKDVEGQWTFTTNTLGVSANAYYVTIVLDSPVENPTIGYSVNNWSSNTVGVPSIWINKDYSTAQLASVVPGAAPQQGSVSFTGSVTSITIGRNLENPPVVAVTI